MASDRDTIIATVLSRCGRRETDTYLLARAQAELPVLQRRLEGDPFKPWFLLTDELTFASVANQRYLPLPSDFLLEWDDYPMTRYDSTQSDPYIELTKDEFNYLQARFKGESAGKPTYYSLAGNQIDFFVTPDDVYSFRWRYFASEAELLTTGNTNAWTVYADDMLIAELGMIMSGQYLRDKYLLPLFVADAARARQRLIAIDEARKQVLRDARMGDRD